uniref:Uncharacterized protein n=1 Tax=Haptolina ericina TaxID=156174 RepID=A0A7S3BUG5_9EUKA
MYALQLGSAKTLQMSGTPVSLPKVVNLVTGWNWLPCPYQSPALLGGQQSRPTFGYAQGDQYKSQAAFAEYYEGYGWYGTLTTLQPGQGYKLKISGSGPAAFQP